MTKAKQKKGMMFSNTTEDTIVMMEYAGESLSDVGSTEYVKVLQLGVLIVLSSKNLGKLKRTEKRKIVVSNK